VLGLAGAGSANIHTSLREAVNALVVKSGSKPLSIIVEGDTRIALEGAFAGGPGIAIIAGTGSMLIGKTPQGIIHTVGGWGRVLGDEGSGYNIGLEALKAVTRDYDNRGDSGTLRRILAGKYGWDSRERVIAAVYREKFDIPSLAPLVLEAAGKNDDVCKTILRHAAALLAEQVSALVRRMDVTTSIGLVMFGGLVDHDTVYSAILGDEILKLCSQVEIRPAMHTPAHGAVLLALEQLKKESTL
jgi:N-acetylglucosamine kinase-like BadF-type ATPase